MFTKINITKFGLFKNFTWPGNLASLSRVNIFFGRNYSGKTTLSRVFDCVSTGELHKDYQDARFELLGEGFTVKETELECSYNVRVYNSDYVKRNMSFLNNEEDGEIKPFALIGQENMKAQEEIDALEEELGDIEKKTGLRYEYDTKKKANDKAQKDNKTAQDRLDSLLKDKANRDIKANPYYVKQGDPYIITHLKKDIDAITARNGDETLALKDSVNLEPEELKRLKQTVDEAEKPIIAKAQVAEPHLTEYCVKVAELVSRKIQMTQVLRDLVENDLLQKWVDEGRERNKDRGTCAFCGNPISEERWKALDAHFSKESEELKTSLSEKRMQLENSSKSLDAFLEDKGFVRQNIYAAFMEEFDAAMEKWTVFVNGYKARIAALEELIDKRLANIFKVVDVNEDNILCEGENRSEGFSQMMTEINELIEKNNDYGKKLDIEKQKARKKLRLDYVHSYCCDIHYLEERAKLEKKAADLLDEASLIDSIAKKIKEKELEIKRKEREKKDEGKAAQKITDLLVRHFGAGSLSLVPEEVEDEVDEETGNPKPKTRFVVKRGNENAKNLSEGERSLISFCYFIAQMDDELNGQDANRLVIFIDDPISSLDSSHIFFMYSLIETKIAKLKRYAQLFISTHNLEFLKYLKRMPLPTDVNQKLMVSHYLIEKYRKGDDDYCCGIKAMPEYMRSYVTEYNYHFEKVYDMAKQLRGDKTQLCNNDYNSYYEAGNNMRKFLECYLFYKYPDTDAPLSHLDKLFDDIVPVEVGKIVNEYSHLYMGERGFLVMDVPEMESAARQILKAVSDKDREHFVSLCDSVGRDADAEWLKAI